LGYPFLWIPIRSRLGKLLARVLRGRPAGSRAGPLVFQPEAPQTSLSVLGSEASRTTPESEGPPPSRSPSTPISMGAPEAEPKAKLYFQASTRSRARTNPKPEHYTLSDLASLWLPELYPKQGGPRPNPKPEPRAPPGRECRAPLIGGPKGVENLNPKGVVFWVVRGGRHAAGRRRPPWHFMLGGVVVAPSEALNPKP
jgi:hypothetical protein